MPVGRVQFYHLGPLTFSEYLSFTSEHELSQRWQSWSPGQPLSELEHSLFIDKYFEYLIVGGMPEAADKYHLSKDFAVLRSVHQSILLSYKSDFGKYSGKVPHSRLERILEYASTQAGRKVKYSSVSPQDQSAQTKQAFDLLEKAQVIQRVYHSSCSGWPLSAGINEKIFKTYFLDIGLMNYALRLDIRQCKQLYSNTENEIQLFQKGMIGEQFVAQNISQTTGPEPERLFYWLRDETTQKAEVDFVLGANGHFLPIEVKSGKSNSIKSLNLFAKEKKCPRAIQLSAQPPKILIRDGLEIIQLPLYFAEKLHPQR